MSWLDQLDREVDFTKVTRYQGFLPRPHLMDVILDETGYGPAMPPYDHFVTGEWPGIDLEVLREAIENG